MPRRIRTALLLLAFTASAQLLASPPGKGFKAMMQKVLDGWNTLDPDQAAPFYAKDADGVFYDITPFQYQGWNEYEQGVRKALLGYSAFKITLGDDVQSHERGSLAWTTATLHMEAVTKAGEAQAFDARWTLIWEKRGTKWLIVHEHVSVPMAASPKGERASE
jgi:ketosteroid isomerase-like protein